MSYNKLELPTFLEHMGSRLVFGEICAPHLIHFLCF